jgi:hypothetical protein
LIGSSLSDCADESHLESAIAVRRRLSASELWALPRDLGRTFRSIVKILAVLVFSQEASFLRETP